MAAALRELHEEIGLADVELSGPVFTRRHVFTWKGEGIDQREEFFVARLASRHEPVPVDSAEKMAEDGVVDHRWFALAELTSVTFSPEDLIDRLNGLSDV